MPILDVVGDVSVAHARFRVTRRRFPVPGALAVFAQFAESRPGTLSANSANTANRSGGQESTTSRPCPSLRLGSFRRLMPGDAWRRRLADRPLASDYRKTNFANSANIADRFEGGKEGCETLNASPVMLPQEPRYSQKWSRPRISRITRISLQGFEAKKRPSQSPQPCMAGNRSGARTTWAKALLGSRRRGARTPRRTTPESPAHVPAGPDRVGESGRTIPGLVPCAHTPD